MAMPLLEQDALDGNVPRLYRHDLESFAWVLLYVCICIDAGEERLDKEPISAWIQVDHALVREKKSDFLLNLSKRIKTYGIDKTAYFAPLVNTLKLWRREHTNSDNTISLALPVEDHPEVDSATPLADHETSDQELLRQVLKPWKWTKDLDWIAFVVDRGKDSSN